MKKSINIVTNNKTFIKKANQEKIKINPNYFNIKFIPYNKILNNLLIYLHLKLSPSLFNEVYKYLTNEIKKFLKKNISSFKMTNNISFNKKPLDLNLNNLNNKNSNKRMISEFCSDNYDFDKNKLLTKARTKLKLKKQIQPLINLSYSQKLKYEILNNKEISSFSNIANKNISNNISLLEDKDLSLFLSDNNYTIDALNKKTKIKKISNKNRTCKQSKNKL